MTILTITCRCKRTFSYERGSRGPKRWMCDKCLDVAKRRSQANYRHRHRKSIRKYIRRYHAAHKEERRVYMREYHLLPVPAGRK